MDKMVKQLSEFLIHRNWCLATAESCTGGGVAYKITSQPGSSKWFDRGFVTYNNQSKIDMLGVKQSTLDEFGAVSEQTVFEMAQGALKHSNAQLSLAITGIAGPEGGMPDKPVGTVWFAWAGENIEPRAEVQHFQGDRASIRQQSVDFALEGLIIFCNQN